MTPTLLLLKGGDGRPGPLLLSGGRQNTSVASGNTTAHNFDNCLWISWDGSGAEWTHISLSSVHNRLLPLPAPADHRFTSRINTTWQDECPVRESSAATSLYQVRTSELAASGAGGPSVATVLVLYPQLSGGGQPIGACPSQKWDGASRGWSMRFTVSW